MGIRIAIFDLWDFSWGVSKGVIRIIFPVVFYDSVTFSKVTEQTWIIPFLGSVIPTKTFLCHN